MQIKIKTHLTRSLWKESQCSIGCWINLLEFKMAISFALSGKMQPRTSISFKESCNLSQFSIKFGMETSLGNFLRNVSQKFFLKTCKSWQNLQYNIWNFAYS